jgi:folate-binding protein YgfZ
MRAEGWPALNSPMDAAAHDPVTNPADPARAGGWAIADPARAGRSATASGDRFTSRPGAVGDPPQHYGNPLVEQRALAEGRAVVDLSDRAVITLTGEDRLTWLDSLTSQAVAKLQPGESAETLLLDPSGRVEHAMRVLDDGVTTYLLVDAASGTGTPGDPDALQAFLSRMVFMLRVEVGRSDLRTVGLFGARGGNRAAVVGEDAGHGAIDVPAASPHGVPLVWRDPWGSGVSAGGWQYAAVQEHPASTWSYREVLVDADADLSALPAAGTLALEALRIAAWRPRIGDADERTIPHELDWLRSAVHLSKGCYRGQETVAKVHNLGHPPRRMVMLHLDGSDGVLPAPGSVVKLAADGGAEHHAAADHTAGDHTAADHAAAEHTAAEHTAAEHTAVHTAADHSVVGSVTASALHFELGPIALAVVKRNVDPAADLVVIPEDDANLRIAAAQELIVPPDAGAEANVPRLPRLGAVTRGS